MRTPSRGEIWMCSLNPTKGREQSVVRPALIISDDFFNNSSAELVIVIPITSKKREIPLHVLVASKDSGLKVDSYIKCEDIRSISKDRLIDFLGNINNDVLTEVEYKLKILLGF